MPCRLDGDGDPSTGELADPVDGVVRAGVADLAAPAQLVAASLRAATDYRSAPYEAPCFVLVGNESQGLPKAYEAECDLTVTIPMRGRADSLNAAIAAAVLAYEVLARLERA